MVSDTTHPDIEKINRVLEQLTSQLIAGYAALQAFKNLQVEYNAGHFGRWGFFFTTAYLSCRYSAEMTLATLALPDKDSVNVLYVLNLAEAAATRFPYGTKDQVLAAVTDHRIRLSKLNQLMATLKRHRDQRLAHLDRRFVTNPESVLEVEPLDSNEIEDAYQALLDIFNTYTHLAADSELYIGNLKTDIARDVERIFDRLMPAQRGTS